MNRRKRLYLLSAVFVVLCGVTFALTRAQGEQEKIKDSGEIILEVPSETVQSLSWEYGDTKLAFHRDPGWLYDGDEAFPVAEAKITELLEPFEAFGVSFVIEDVTDYGMYGLESPVCTIEFATEDRSYTVELGDFSSMDSERYISIGDGNVYLAKVDPLEQFDASLQDMIDHDEPLSYDRISNMEVSGVDDYSVFYAEDQEAAYTGEDVYFTERAGAVVPLDRDRVDSYLGYLTTVDLSDYVTYDATAEDLKRCGLDAPELTVSVDYTDRDADGNEFSDTFILSVSCDPEELARRKQADAAAPEDAETPEEEIELTAYARVGDSPIIYRISEVDCLNLMAASFNDLRHRELLTADFADVEQIDVQLEGSAYSFTASGKEEERSWSYLDRDVEIGGLQAALEDLQAASADSFTDEAPDGKEEIRLTVSFRQEERPPVEIALYRHDGGSCLAVVDGAPFALVDRSGAVDLIEEVHAIVLN
jgi:hypothetical protein